MKVCCFNTTKSVRVGEKVTLFLFSRANVLSAREFFPPHNSCLCNCQALSLFARLFVCFVCWLAGANLDSEVL